MAGRKRIDETGEKRDVKINAYVTAQMSADIQDLARFKKISVASLIVNAIDEYITPRLQQINNIRELEKGLQPMIADLRNFALIS